MLRELAWLDVDIEEPVDPEGEQGMSDEEFMQEVEAAGRGDWASLDLDELPDGWQAATIEDLKNA